MDVETISGALIGPQNLDNSKTASETENPFKDYLQVITESKSAQNKDPNMQQEKDKEELTDFEYLKKYGFTEYAEKVREEKIAEIREKLLKAMGLTEESLAELPASQRAQIESRIAEEIERRMAANSEVNQDKSALNETLGELPTVLSSRPGIGNGVALMQAIEQQEIAETELITGVKEEK
ncbi:MAG: hypothetical protein OQK35_05135 [Alphaproteobacteria bacterium]|nr:hypothetical protein [Alphaproteobacteria bacterium]